VIWRGLALAVMAIGMVLADASSDVFDLVASMAAGLSDDNAAAFANALSVELPNRDRLIGNVNAMLAQAEVVSAIDRISDDGDDSKRTLVLDWSLQLKRKGPDLQIIRRREAVTVSAVREGKKWKVVALSPESFFGPPEFR
jgi:hypothetical protein